MYVTPNYKTKKALKDAVASGIVVTVYNPGLGGEPPTDGKVTAEGPHFPEPHKWYAELILKDSVVVKVK